ncbi:MAG: ribose-5-phosphate isomerase RpiA [Methylacidiphilales bacterium]|nr:ribose-5-phosphate isomerase RpiA [Candidatus Methylacidiphilales bacterium]
MSERKNSPPKNTSDFSFVDSQKMARQNKSIRDNPEINVINPNKVSYENDATLPKLPHISGLTLNPNEVNALKKLAAKKSLEYIKHNMVIGIGTGTTVNELIPLLTSVIHDIDGVVSSSAQTTEKLLQVGITPYPLHSISKIHLYIDGADQINHNFEMIKGGGGALTGEKILVAMAQKFICIVDTTKLVKEFSSPIPLEIIPMSLPLVNKKITELGGICYPREGYKTEYGNLIIDVRGLDTTNPKQLELYLNSIEGVVTNGLFTHHPADIMLMGTKDGVLEYNRIKRNTSVNLVLQDF